MEDQHQRIDATLARIAEVLPEWRLTASKGTGEKLAITMEEHRATLVEHLDDEERYVLALIAEHMSVAEWEAVGARAVGQIAKEKPMLSMGAILEETPGRAPAPPRQAACHRPVAVEDRRPCQYAKRVLRLRGPLRRETTR